MGRENLFVGLEIGTSKICVAVGEADLEGNIRVLGIGEAPSRGVRKGEIVDFETAHKCVRDALAEAEEVSDVMIENVFVGVSGGHISGFNSRGAVTLPPDRDEIDATDYRDVAISARDIGIPASNAFLHTILQHYYVDGQDVLNPVGMSGRKLEADFHLIHGVANRIKNTVRCVSEIGLQVEDVVFNGLASSQVVLSQHQKDLGALVIDIGGGTTDYIVYVDGALKQSGVLAVGGDHVTNDLSMGLRIPMTRAERLKIDEGSVCLGAGAKGEPIRLPEEYNFAGLEVDREVLNTIIHYRIREALELVRRKVEMAAGEEGDFSNLGAGVFITGGCARINGISELAQEVFGSLPVHVGFRQPVSGLMAGAADSHLAAAVGLIRYGQWTYATRPRKKGFRSWLESVFGLL
ncbi:MAG TPA: cell division protein FtsA [Chthoniobacteraceae bacterium]|nr:cell division protein FtsA [Chthoniobacteraceae bacterium]